MHACQRDLRMGCMCHAPMMRVSLDRTFIIFIFPLLGVARAVPRQQQTCLRPQDARLVRNVAAEARAKVWACLVRVMPIQECSRRASPCYTDPPPNLPARWCKAPARFCQGFDPRLPSLHCAEVQKSLNVPKNCTDSSTQSILLDADVSM